MRIAHIDGFSGVPWRLAKAQRRLGHEALVFATRESPFLFPYDVKIQSATGPLRWNAAMFAQWRTFESFDVVHVHGGIWMSQLFYPVFRERFRRKTLAVHLHGSETRTGKGVHHLRHADILFCATPDLRERLPLARWVPNPIELPQLPEEVDHPVPIFGHFPSKSWNKGTDRIIDSFVRTFSPVSRDEVPGMQRYRGRGAELRVVSGVSHEEALRIMVECDAVVDQLSPIGAYGMVAVEAMAYGKPVLSSVRPEWYPDCPILPITPESIDERLARVAANAQDRREWGRSGRAYVANVHEAGKVARQVVEAYRVSRLR